MKGTEAALTMPYLIYAQMLNNENYEVTVIVPSAGNMIDEGMKRGLKVKLFYYYPAVYRKKVIFFFWLRKRLRNIFTMLQLSIFIKKTGLM